MSAAASAPFELKGFLNHNFPNNTTLHGCVASNVAAIQRFVQGKKFHPSRLSEHHTEYKLTPMHVAALTGDVKRVDALIAAGGSDSLMLADYAGNLPVHLAVMRGDEAMLQKLIDASIKADKKFAEIHNCHLGTVLSLIKICKPPQHDPQQSVAQFKDKDGNLKPLTAEEYQKMTRTVYCDYVQSSHRLLCQEWLDKNPKQDPKFYQTLWQRFQNAPPQIYLEEQLPMGFGVCTAQPIPQNAMVIPWGGEWIDPRKTTHYSDKSVGTTESIKQGNPASLINDGFPNVFVAKIPLEGCPESLAVYALRPIAKDEKLTVNYHSHRCKFDRYAFVVEGWEKSFNREGLGKKLEEISTLHAKKRNEPNPFHYTRAEIFKVVQWVSEPLYILETPRALIHLIMHNLVTWEDIVTMEKIEACYRLPKTHPSDTVIVEFRKYLKDFLKTISLISDQDYQECILEVLDNSFKNHRAIVGIFLLHPMKQRLSYELFKSDLEKFAFTGADFIRGVQEIDRFLDLAPDLFDPAKKDHAIAQMKAIYQKVGGVTVQDFCMIITIIHDEQVTNACLTNILVDLKR